MTREEAEKKILEHLIEIKKIANRFAPDDEYLNCGIIGNYIMANNSFYKPDRDPAQKIDFHFDNGVFVSEDDF